MRPEPTTRPATAAARGVPGVLGVPGGSGVPSVPGVLTADDVHATGAAIARMQEPSGLIPWYPGGHADPWDHVESAMGLSVAGFHAEAEAAYEWSARTQRADGSWPMRVRGNRVELPDTDVNFCAYIATGVRHHFLVTGDEAFARRMWPAVRRAIDLTLRMQAPGGEIWWAADADGRPFRQALLTGNASIRMSLECAVLLAESLGMEKPGWELALQLLDTALAEALAAEARGAAPLPFTGKPEYSMDWYYPVLGGVLRGDAACDRLARRWDDFVVPGLGIRCVDHKPWVTGAETCELALALAALGADGTVDTGSDSRFGSGPGPDCAAGSGSGSMGAAREQLAAMQHLRDPDGTYWTGLVFADGKRWPVEVSSWTSAAVLLAADAISGATGGARIFADAARAGAH